MSVRGGLESGVCDIGPADTIGGSRGAAIRNKQARRFIADAFKIVGLLFLSSPTHGVVPWCLDDGRNRNGV